MIQNECFDAAIEWAKHLDLNSRPPVDASAHSAPPTAPNKCGSATDQFSAPFCEGYSFAERESFRTAVEKMLD